MASPALLRLSRGLCSSVGTMSGFYAELLAPSGAYKCFLNNEWKESASGKHQAIVCPSTNGPVYEVQGERPAAAAAGAALCLWASVGACTRQIRGPGDRGRALRSAGCILALAGQGAPRRGPGGGPSEACLEPEAHRPTRLHMPASLFHP